MRISDFSKIKIYLKKKKRMFGHKSCEMPNNIYETINP